MNLFDNEIKLNENVSIKIPKVKDVINNIEHQVFSIVIMQDVREAFSNIPDKVDIIEERFPTTFDMYFDDEMNFVYGKRFGVERADAIFIMAIEYWTGIKAENFEKLQNSEKFICNNPEWVIDKKEFLNIREYIRKINRYEVDEMLVAPKGISKSERVMEAFSKAYERRLEKRQKGQSIEDKIIVLQTCQYIPLDEISEMSIYHFHRLYEGFVKKEEHNMLSIFGANGRLEELPEFWILDIMDNKKEKDN